MWETNVRNNHRRTWKQGTPIANKDEPERRHVKPMEFDMRWILRMRGVAGPGGLAKSLEDIPASSRAF